MRRMLAVGASLLAMVAAAGCEPAPDLVVDMRTDLVCGVEFHSAEVSVDGALMTTALPDAEQDFLTGVRLAELEMLETGTHHVEVSLRLGSEVVAERSMLVDLQRTRVVTAIFTRSCEGISCNGSAGDASRETCLGGSCVAGGCAPELDATCVTECTTDADCAAAQDCSAATCDGGVCLQTDSGSCGPDQFCHPSQGCLPLGSEGCPPFMQAGDGFCIDIYQQSSMTWTDASAFCQSRGGDLCTPEQWLAACTDPDSLLDRATDDWEWTNDVTDDVGGKSGAGSCDARSGHEIFVDPYGVRCCVPME